MSNPQDPKHAADAEGEEDEEEYAPTPFDNPYFLPVVLGAFALWLFYDGFLNGELIHEWTEAGEAWKVSFNRWGAAIVGGLAAWFTWKAVRERRTSQDGAES